MAACMPAALTSKPAVTQQTSSASLMLPQDRIPSMALCSCSWVGLCWQMGCLLLGEQLPWLEEGLPLVVKVLQPTTLYAALFAGVGELRSPLLEVELVLARPQGD